MSTPRRPQRGPALPQHGFTLLELLVVMTLLAVIMGGLVSALRTMAQTETRIDQRLDQLDEARVARAFLQQTLGRVSAYPLDAPGAPGKKAIAFAAGTNSLAWIGIMPARPTVGGRYFFRLGIEDTSDGQALVLRFAPWVPDAWFPDWSTTDHRVLIRGIQHLTVQAQGLAPKNRNPLEPWPKGWASGWPVTDSPPEQVRLGLSDARGDWPEWTFPVYALPQSDSSYSSVVIGGSR